jgi:protein-disulfide isomerase
LLVVHDTAKTGVAPVAVSCVSVRLPLAIVFGVVRVNVVGHFSRRSDSGDVQAALHAADLSIKRHCLRSDDGDRQTHTGKTCRSQEKERVPNHMREIALFRSCGNWSGAERLYQFVKLTFSKASHYELKGGHGEIRLQMDSKKRSTLLTIGAIIAGYAALRTVPSLLPEKLELQALDRPEGFRKFVAGETSGGFDPFVGLGTADSTEVAAQKAAALTRVSENICSALYGGLSPTPTQVPMASFSDYYCPFCRVQTKRLADMTSEMPDKIAVAWHELPLLGDSSNLAAKAALAAKRQGAYVAFHERLMTTPFQASPEYLARLSDDIGVDSKKLITDMESAEITRELEDSAALARVFAFVGTPALVIGRTVVQGQISDRMVREIIELEREEGWQNVCKAA